MTSRQRSLVDNAADPSQVADGQRVVREREKRYREALQRIAATLDGEILFERDWDTSSFFTTTFSADGMQMAFNEGGRYLVAQRVKDWQLARPDILASLLQRRASEQKLTPSPKDSAEESDNE